MTNTQIWTCKWCGKKYGDTLLGKPKGKLCPRCRAKADAGGKPPKRDAMSRRLPGHYGAKEGG